MLIRRVEEADARAILDIYAPYVAETSISFEYEIPSLGEMASRIRELLPCYPYLAAVSEGQLVAYAYAGPHKSRAAYQWNAELSVYVDRNHRGRGTGRALYGALLEILARQNFVNIYGVVTTPNPASQRLHEFFGFNPAGRLRRSGYKEGAWHDIVIYEKSLAAEEGPPAGIRPFNQLDETLLEAILARHSRA